MADVIKVSPEKLQSASSDLRDIGKSVKSTTTEMLSIVSGISQNVWSGEASSAFIKKFSGLQDDITKMCRRLDEQSAHLSAIATEYRTTEASNKAQTARLKSKILG